MLEEEDGHPVSVAPLEGGKLASSGSRFATIRIWDLVLTYVAPGDVTSVLWLPKQLV